MRVEVKKDPEGPDITVEIHCRDITDEVSRLERHIKRFKAYIPAAENGEMLRLDREHGTHTIYLVAYINGTYIRVSNIIEYTN